MSDIPHLGELELVIMDYVWKQPGDVTVPDVHADLKRRRRLAYTTVMTVMTRLHEKGLLERDEDKRPYRYRAALTREDYSAGLMLDVLEEFGDRSSVLARFVERIPPEDAQVLRKLAAKARGKRR